MKAGKTAVALSLALVLGCAGGGSWPSQSDQPAFDLLGFVTVEPTDISLSDDQDTVNRELWDLFANSDLHKRFSEIGVPSGADAWSVYSGRLIEVARERQMDAESLRRVLERIESEDGLPVRFMQILPYGAFLGRQGDKSVWVVPCVWSPGVSYDTDHRPRPQKLGHIKIWAFSADGQERVGFAECK